MKVIVNSSRCGAGKTTNIIKQANLLYQLDESVLIVQPSIDLMNETKAKMPHAIAINSSNCDNVGEALKRHSASDMPEILIISHQAFLLTDFDQRKWHLSFDEECDPYRKFELNTPKNWEALRLDHQYTVYPFDENYDILLADKNWLEETLEAGDDVWNLFSELHKALYSKYYQVHVEKDFLEKLRSGGKIVAHLMLQKEKFDNFKSINLYGAMIQNSFMVQQMKFLYRVDSKYTKHDGNNIIIHYADNSGWSKRANELRYNEKQVFLKYVRDHVGNEPTLYIDNNSEPNQDWTRLSHNVHGQNQYQHYKNVVLMSAINPNPYTFKYLEQMCEFNTAMAKKHFMANLYYQTIMRTALRVQNNAHVVNVFCLDGRIADFLMFEYFDKPLMHKIECTNKKPTCLPLTPAERNKVCHLKKQWKELEGIMPRDIMALNIWKYTSHRGLINEEISELLIKKAIDRAALFEAIDDTW